MSNEIEMPGKECVEKEYQVRKTQNPLYSMRAFARDLGIGKSTLCDFLANKRKLSKKNSSKVAANLGLSPFQRKTINGQDLSPEDRSYESKVLAEDQFRLVSDWYYFAILNLAKLPSNRATSQWISQRIGIKKKEAENALERLQRLGLLAIEKGKLKRTVLPLTTSRDIPSEAIRKHHRHCLQLAQASLDQDSVQEREFSSLTMCIQKSKLPQAKNYLMKCKRKLSRILEGGSLESQESQDEVYIFSYQLFPIKNRKYKKRKSSKGAVK